MWGSAKMMPPLSCWVASSYWISPNIGIWAFSHSLQPFSSFWFYSGWPLSSLALSSPSVPQTAWHIVGAHTKLSNEWIRLISFMDHLPTPGLCQSFASIIVFLITHVKYKPSSHFLYVLWKSRCKKAIHDQVACLCFSGPPLPCSSLYAFDDMAALGGDSWSVKCMCFMASVSRTTICSPHRGSVSCRSWSSAVLKDPVCFLLWASSGACYPLMT